MENPSLYKANPIQPETNDYMPASLSETPTFNGIESRPNSVTVQPTTQIYDDADDDEEEEIVFKPAVAEKYPITNESTSISTFTHPSDVTQKTAQPIQISTVEPIQPIQISAKEIIQPTLLSVQETIQPQPMQIPYKGIQTNLNAQLPAQGAPLSNFQLGIATASHSQPLQSVNLNTSKWLMEQAILSNTLKNQHNGNGVLHNYEQQQGLRSIQPAEYTPQLGNFSQQQALRNMNMNMNTSKWSMEQATLSNGLTNLNINGNGFLASNHGVQGGLSSMPMISASSVHPISRPVNHSHMTSRMTSSSMALPNAPLKVPTSKPTRHLGPPPGFTNISSKQPEDSTLESMINGNGNGNITLMDDYRWLDEYQPSPVTASGVVSNVSLNDSAVRYNGAMDFPFPGKQIPNVPAQVVDDEWMDFKRFEHARLNSEQKKPAMIPDQFQAQTLWPPGYHV